MFGLDILIPEIDGANKFCCSNIIYIGCKNHLNNQTQFS